MNHSGYSKLPRLRTVLPGLRFFYAAVSVFIMSALCSLGTVAYADLEFNENNELTPESAAQVEAWADAYCMANPDAEGCQALRDKREREREERLKEWEEILDAWDEEDFKEIQADIWELEFEQELLDAKIEDLGNKIDDLNDKAGDSIPPSDPSGAGEPIGGGSTSTESQEIGGDPVSGMDLSTMPGVSDVVAEPGFGPGMDEPKPDDRVEESLFAYLQNIFGSASHFTITSITVDPNLVCVWGPCPNVKAGVDISVTMEDGQAFVLQAAVDGDLYGHYSFTSLVYNGKDYIQMLGQRFGDQDPDVRILKAWVSGNVIEFVFLANGVEQQMSFDLIDHGDPDFEIASRALNAQIRLMRPVGQSELSGEPTAAPHVMRWGAVEVHVAENWSSAEVFVWTPNSGLVRAEDFMNAVRAQVSSVVGGYDPMVILESIADSAGYLQILAHIGEPGGEILATFEIGGYGVDSLQVNSAWGRLIHVDHEAARIDAATQKMIEMFGGDVPLGLWRKAGQDGSRHDYIFEHAAASFTVSVDTDPEGRPIKSQAHLTGYPEANVEGALVAARQQMDIFTASFPYRSGSVVSRVEHVTYVCEAAAGCPEPNSFMIDLMSGVNGYYYEGFEISAKVEVRPDGAVLLHGARLNGHELMDIIRQYAGDDGNVTRIASIAPASTGQVMVSFNRHDASGSEIMSGYAILDSNASLIDFQTWWADWNYPQPVIDEPQPVDTGWSEPQPVVDEPQPADPDPAQTWDDWYGYLFPDPCVIYVDLEALRASAVNRIAETFNPEGAVSMDYVGEDGNGNHIFQWFSGSPYQVTVSSYGDVVNFTVLDDSNQVVEGTDPAEQAERIRAVVLGSVQGRVSGTDPTIIYDDQGNPIGWNGGSMPVYSGPSEIRIHSMTRTGNVSCFAIGCPSEGDFTAQVTFNVPVSDGGSLMFEASVVAPSRLSGKDRGARIEGLRFNGHDFVSSIRQSIDLFADLRINSISIDSATTVTITYSVNGADPESKTFSLETGQETIDDHKSGRIDGGDERIGKNPGEHILYIGGQPVATTNTGDLAMLDSLSEAKTAQTQSTTSGSSATFTGDMAEPKQDPLKQTV